MKTHTVRPTGQTQSFAVNETFFSTTDSKGVTTAGNAVFCRTSGYSWEELVGRPHNLIRHPDMPRLIFRLLWQACREGRPFMGYIKNQAKNGNHYWVFAVVVPIPGGFLSVRFKPTSPLLAHVEAIYEKMRDAEAAAIAAGQAEGPAADAAVPILSAELRNVGFDALEPFSHHALNTEIKARDGEIAKNRLTLFPETIDAASADARGLRDFHRESLTVYRSINELFGLLDSFISLCDGIRARKDAVQAIADDFRLNAFNANIAAHGLGETGPALSTVARNLSSCGESLSRNVGILAANIVRTVAAVSDIASNLSAARLQVEMLLSFTAEISSGMRSEAETTRALAMIGDLRSAFSSTLQHAFDAIAELESHLPAVMTSKEDLRKDIIFLQVARTTGRTEVSRLQNAESISATFADLNGQIENGRAELDQLDDIADRLAALTSTCPVRMAAIRKATASIHDLQSAPRPEVPVASDDAEPAVATRQPSPTSRATARSLVPRA